MRVSQHTAETLVVEEGRGTQALLGSSLSAFGALGVWVGWTREGKVLFLIVGAIFLLYGLKALLLDRPKTHRFERWRGMLAIDSKGLRNERSAPSDYL